MAFRTKSAMVVPQGMLAPNGYVDTPVDPFVQATTRPPGTLLAPSPGYDSIREGKNVFQGKGPTGGFRPMTFAEDVDGTGAALSVIPGDTSPIEASEWIEGSPGQTPEGTFIIADRSLNPGYASKQNQAYNTLPDMGDRHPSRPLSNEAASWIWAPVNAFKNEYGKSPVVAVVAGGLAVFVAYHVAKLVEDTARGRGVAPPAKEVERGDTDVIDTVTAPIQKVVDAAVSEIESVTNQALGVMKKTESKD